jgi:hypothetical protein
MRNEAQSYGTGVLRKVQEKGGDQESKAGDSKEQTPCDSGCLPGMRKQGIPHR